MLSQIVINGLIIGSIYALVAAGFSLIYSTSKLMHFAHGSSVVFSAYFFFYCINLNLPAILAGLLAIIAASILGMGMHVLIYEPLKRRHASNIALLIASLATLILLQNILTLLFGTDIKTLYLIPITNSVTILGAAISPFQIAIILIAIWLYFALRLFMNKTRIGKKLRAVADNKELAAIAGINERRITILSYLIGSGIAGIAGIIIALEQLIEPTMGTTLMIKGFTGSIIGGIASVPGSIIGSYILGLAENIAVWWLPSGYRDGIAFLLLFLFLLCRPQGLFSHKNKEVRS